MKKITNITKLVTLIVFNVLNVDREIMPVHNVTKKNLYRINKKI